MVLFPFSIPFSIEKDLSIPFPCQDHGCACASAKQCWSGCCCFTEAQKDAWVKANLDPLKDKKTLTEIRLVRSEASSLHERIKKGLHGEECARCRSVRPAEKKSLVQKEVKEKENKKRVVVLTSLIQKCQGKPFSWTTLPWAIITEQSADESPLLVCAVSMKESRIAEIAFEPDVPPPRS